MPSRYMKRQGVVAKTSWNCPCNGCKKAQKVIIDQIIEEYRFCPNIIESEERLYCYTWWRHDDCVRIMHLLYNITGDSKYTVPENSWGMNDKNKSSIHTKRIGFIK